MTLITKLLTNPLTKSQSTADPDDQSPASGPSHHAGRLSMAWNRSGVRVPQCSLTRTLVTCDAVEQDGIGLIPLAASTIIHDHLPLHRVWVRLSNV
jgi:hypothetical protein